MNKKILIVLIVIIAVVLVSVFAFNLMSEDDEEVDEGKINNVEASTDGIKVGDVRHNPENPTAGGQVDYYCKVEGIPADYTVLLCAYQYDNDTLLGRSTSTMLKKSGISYTDTSFVNEDSGHTVKYKIMIYEQDWREVDDLYEDYEPILESDLHSYIVQ